MDEIDILKRRLLREINARKQAEAILEEKALQLYKLNEELESKIVERTTELRISEEKYRGILENMELGLLEMDNEHNIITAYDWFCDMTGYCKEELIGQNAIDFLWADGNDLKVLQAEMQKRQRGQAGVYELQIKHKKGHKLWVLVSSSPLIDVNGNVIGLVGIHYDITNRKQLELDLTLAKKVAEASQEAEKQFLAKMSHEIRTPLNAILGMAYLLLDTETTEEQNEYLSTLNHSAHILKHLISDILDFSKIQAGEVNIKISEFDLHHLIKNLQKLAQLRLQNKSVSINSYVDERIVNKLLGDELLLNQILLNLVTNAIKFTEKGNIDIVVNLLDSNEKYMYLDFQIVDTGIGIPPDMLNTIFDDFKQVDNSMQPHAGGTGLGLSITKQLVELHGGDLSVKSIPNVRTVFSVKLKYEKAAKVSSESKKKFMVTKSRKFVSSRLLVAEDNLMNQRYIAALLKKWHIQFEFANDGEEAYQKALQTHYDLIFMDISMPKRNGFEVTALIRDGINPNQHTPIVALSAFAFVQTKEEAIRRGMNDFLGKPFDPDNLLRIFDLYLDTGIKMNREEEAIVSTVFDDTSIFLPPFDTNHLTMLYGNDLDYAKEMLTVFYEYTIPEMKRLKSFVEEKEMKKAGKMAHKLKANFEMVGLLQMKEGMQLLEDHCLLEEVDQAWIERRLWDVNMQLKEILPKIKHIIDSLLLV
jgi:PAS domain S-box-containing protein